MSLAPSSTVSSPAISPGPSLSVVATPSILPPPQPPCNAPQACDSPSPASLYLYTFLAVLTILLLVSTAILARSAALRRRERTAVAWAVPGCPHRDAEDAKPTLFEAHVAGYEVDAARAEEQRWHNMKPLSASMSANAQGAPRLPPSSRWHSNSSPTPSLRAAWGEIRRGSGGGPRLDGASSPAPGSLPPAEPPPPTPAALRIALIVSMPMPCRSQHDEIPCMEFGVVEADVVDPGKMSSRPDGGRSGW